MKNVLALVVLALGFAGTAHAENLLCFERGQVKTQGDFYQEATRDSRRGCVMAVLQRRGADEVRVYQFGRRSERFATNANWLEIRETAIRMGCEERICDGNADINVGGRRDEHHGRH